MILMNQIIVQFILELMIILTVIINFLIITKLALLIHKAGKQKPIHLLLIVLLLRYISQLLLEAIAI